jgi:hypothetical protein
MRNRDRTRRRRLLGTAFAAALVGASLAWCVSAPVAQAASAPTWSSVSPATTPPPLAYASMAYDSDNGTVVLFGGQATDGTLSATTWVWNGSSWSPVPSSVPARARASMAFDPKLHQLILFGGIGAGGQLLNDTWAWNGATWYPETPPASSPSPTPRQGASLAFDATDQLVLFGGTGEPAGNPSPADPSAPAVATPAVAAALGDTWVWTGSSWYQQTGGAPPGRTDAALAWDPMTGRSVLFGGSTAPAGTTPAAGLLGETWSWSSGTWSPLAPATSPPPEEDLTLAADPDLGGLIAFGGETGSGPSSATWLWDGSNWSTLAAGGAPAARQGAAAAYDAAAHQLVVFGGMGARGGVLGDTEVLAAHAPSTATPTPTTPAATTTTHPAVPPSAAVIGRPAPTGPPGSAGTSTTTVGAPATGGRQALPVATLQLHPGGLMTLHGSGFSPGSPVTITFHSTPFLVGRATAGADGTFIATVAVPTDAAPGLHHFEAQGTTPAGTALLLVTPVQVVLLSAHHDAVLQAMTLVAISVVLPAGCWLVMGLQGRRRRTARA